MHTYGHTLGGLPRNYSSHPSVLETDPEPSALWVLCPSSVLSVYPLLSTGRRFPQNQSWYMEHTGEEVSGTLAYGVQEGHGRRGLQSERDPHVLPQPAHLSLF